jgi:spore coat polysaccharide biosynthesis protein SpsF (cytidylyltransferase family)
MKEKNNYKLNKLRIVAAIQARMGSTRLTDKVLKKISGRTIIEWIKYRLSFSKELDQLVLATVATKENDPLVRLADEIGLAYYRGSEYDLIERIYNTALCFGADAVVRITADAPLVDPEIVDNLVRLYRQRAAEIDYVCNIFPPTYPDGLDIELISFGTLQRLNKEVNNPLYREWITTTVLEHPQNYRILNVANSSDQSHLRLTLDYPEDLALIEIIFKRLHRENKVFLFKDILTLLDKEPALLRINEKWIDRTIVNNIRSRAFHQEKLKEYRPVAK